MYFAQSKPKDSHTAWSDYIAAEVPTCEGVLAPEARSEIINAIAHYCSKYAEGTVLRSELIPQLFLRAAGALGSGTLSGAVLASGKTSDHEISEIIDCGNLPDGVQELIATGWLRPLRGRLDSDGSNWIIDLRRLFANSECVLEMALLTELRRTLVALAIIWDPSRGKGTIALRGVQQVSVKILGDRRRSSRASRLVLETRSYCEQIFTKIAKDRGWSEQPLVVVRDI